MPIYDQDNLEDEALFTAIKAHGDQQRRGGEPYVNHPIRVANIVDRVKGDSHRRDVLQAASYLHDTREDTSLTDEEILKYFGPDVLTLVHELTSDEHELKRLGKTEYLKKKLAGISSWALVIKLADRLDNVSDLMTADLVWALKYATQTKDILDYLKITRILTKTQKQLITEIEDILSQFFKKPEVQGIEDQTSLLS